MNIQTLYEKLEERFPRSLSCDWDNDGLMVCADTGAPLQKIMLALDATEDALEAAACHGCSVLITHHPLLFRPLKSLNETTLNGRKALYALQHGISVISLHTRLDASEGGVNDALLHVLSLPRTGTFGPADAPTLGRLSEIPTETDAVLFTEKIRQALDAPCVFLTGDRPVRRIAVVGGDGKDCILPAIDAGADTLITGAASYNSALDASELNLNVIEAGHYYTEAPVLPVLADICQNLSGVPCILHNSNRTTCVR